MFKCFNFNSCALFGWQREEKKKSPLKTDKTSPELISVYCASFAFAFNRFLIYEIDLEMHTRRCQFAYSDSFGISFFNGFVYRIFVGISVVLLSPLQEASAIV